MDPRLQTVVRLEANQSCSCLSFYYTGLSRAQLRQTLESILKADDPGSAYARLIQNCSELPGPLREWTMVNVEDEGQLDELLKHLRFDVAVIDFFMNQAVFPKHFRQFEGKQSLVRVLMSR